jgi:uncharacterized protein (DUF433 family)
MATQTATESRPRVSVEHIEIDERGNAKLIGHRIKVRHIVELMRAQGYTADQIQSQAYPHLTRAQVYAALAYYYDHQDEIDRQIEEAYRLEEELRPKLENRELREKIRARTQQS